MTNPQPSIPGSLIDDDFFTQIGFPDLPEDKKTVMRGSLEGRLELLVAEKMPDVLEETQYDSFKDALNTDNPQIIWEWLTLNCPNYDVIALQCRADLIQEVKDRFAAVNRLNQSD